MFEAIFIKLKLHLILCSSSKFARATWTLFPVSFFFRVQIVLEEIKHLCHLLLCIASLVDFLSLSFAFCMFATSINSFCTNFHHLICEIFHYISLILTLSLFLFLVYLQVSFNHRAVSHRSNINFEALGNILTTINRLFDVLSQIRELFPLI